MHIRKARLLLLSLAISGLAAILLGQKSADRPDEFQLAVATLKDSRWTQVNREPYYISSQLDGLCRIATPGDYASLRKQNPHASTHITVFVNQLARKPMFSGSPQQFPEGAIIVKAKFDGFSAFAGDKTPSPILYTVMIKRHAGYNPEAGDWEFGVVSGDGKKTEGAGKLANCMSCHTSRRDGDFVFRSYLTTELRQSGQ